MMTIRQKRAVFYISNIAVPLFLGLIIYLLSSPDVYIAKAFSIPGIIFHGSSFMPDLLYKFIRNFLTDILWAYSLTFAVASVLGYSHRSTIAAVIICTVFSTLVEIFQKLGIFSGTFDILDILFEASAVLSAEKIIIDHEENYLYEV